MGVFTALPTTTTYGFRATQIANGFFIELCCWGEYSFTTSKGVFYKYRVCAGDDKASRIIVENEETGEQTSVWFESERGSWDYVVYYLKGCITEEDLRLLEHILEIAPEMLFDPENDHTYRGLRCVTIGARMKDSGESTKKRTS